MQLLMQYFSKNYRRKEVFFFSRTPFHKVENHNFFREMHSGPDFARSAKTLLQVLFMYLK